MIETAQQARVESMQHQLLVYLDAELVALTRVAAELPHSSRDELTIAMAVLFVTGLLHQRRAEAARLESSL